jgi:hypothetical protein
MTTSLDFDYDLKSSTGGELGLFLVLVSSFVLTASVVVVDSVLGNPLVGVSTVANTSPNLLSGALGWPSCSRAHFWSHNVLRPWRCIHFGWTGPIGIVVFFSFLRIVLFFHLAN